VWGSAERLAPVMTALPTAPSLPGYTLRVLDGNHLPASEKRLAALRGHRGAALPGIVPAHPLWGEVMAVLFERGGNFGKFFKDVMARLFGLLAAPPAGDAEGWPGLEPYPAAAYGTRPP